VSSPADGNDRGAGLQLRPPRSPEEWERYYDLRWRVLRQPWDQPRGSERDDRETDSLHAALWDAKGEPVAVGRLHLNSPEEAQVRYMAVEPGQERQGLGGRILVELERQARQLGAASVVLNSREEAQPFYERHGYEIVAKAPTMFDVIAHARMMKQLDKKS
jgi:predicted GNAT family N-acyltransferase